MEREALLNKAGHVRISVRTRPVRATSVAVYFLCWVCVCSLCYAACNVCEMYNIICSLSGCTIFFDIAT